MAPNGLWVVYRCDSCHKNIERRHVCVDKAGDNFHWAEDDARDGPDAEGFRCGPVYVKQAN